MYYVSMTDTFMSGWGDARGKVNKHYLECSTYEEAEIVQNNARARGEMKRVFISSSKPSLRKGWCNTYASKKTAPNWYIKDFFKS